ncbi:hypothetical protein Cadr_000023214 [Camelus dromedarius]|uniref:Uncharacterized protein n=1 Tax=Camelus dromedarius TaxID=9838 RepID=A0A5N4CI07_CAMDR|nr:hypothetical protein Cadr_000023214 [Camelus dromedarius]
MHPLVVLVPWVLQAHWWVRLDPAAKVVRVLVVRSGTLRWESPWRDAGLGQSNLLNMTVWDLLWRGTSPCQGSPLGAVGWKPLLGAPAEVGNLHGAGLQRNTVVG